MKINIKNIIYSSLVLFSLSGMYSCNDVLDEKRRSELDLEYLKTPSGLKSSVVAAYSGTRWLFGPDGALCNTVPGTDEFMTTDQMNVTQGSFDTYDKDLSPSNGSVGNYWNNGLQFINGCNGVIEFSENLTDADMSANDRQQMVAEAHFLRGFYYYLLTMNYGDVPLDLGSGRLKNNTLASTTSERSPRSEVFEVIIDDLTHAAENLPDRPSQPGRVGKAAALHFLSKAYLTRASMDFAKSNDYEMAYKTAKERLIDNRATYGAELLQNYADVHKEGNENSSEVLFNVQRTWSASGPNLVFDESNDGPNAVSNKGNRANFFFTSGYENVKVKVMVNGKETEKALVPRSMEYQRPWRMFMPTKWVVLDAFSDKDNDARWDGSFRTEWKAGVDFTVKGRSVKAGELALKISLNQTETAAPTDSVGANGVIYKPYALYYWGMLYNADGTYKNASVQYVYPSLYKYDDTKRENINYDSNRPFILARLAETYLIAAEAAMYMGNASEAARLIDVVRERAAYREGLSAEDLATRKSAMAISGKGTTIDIDFILDERTREMCGESWRWYDLVRTKKLVERVKLHNVRGKNNIKEHHMLRPIPQEQIDLMSDPAQKEKYQNPEY